jgi:metal-responsive CopG/Arc/MetJ family transcriptional regulator
MKTIAVSIDEPTLEALDRLMAPSPGRRVTGRAPRSRSELVRSALHEYLARAEQRVREEREGRIFAAHREQLAREAAALVAEQARR